MRLPRGQCVAGLELAGERVELADGALEVLLADLVVGRGHGAGGVRRLRGSSLAPASAPCGSPAAPAARGGARARAGGVAFVSRNFSACT